MCILNSHVIETHNWGQHKMSSSLLEATDISLTHWSWVMNICIGDLTISGSDNGLSPGWHQAIIWTSAGILFMGPLGTNFSEILIEI